MSNIEITADNIKKFAKRLQKHTKEKGFILSLSESQELLAKTLGSNNYNSLIKNIATSQGLLMKQKDKEEINKLFESVKIEHQPLEKQSTAINLNNESAVFIEKIKAIINHPDNGINLCYLECGNTENHEYSLVFESSFGDHYSFNFCNDIKFLSLFSPDNNAYSPNLNISLGNDFYYYIMKFGLSVNDALKISELLISPDYNVLRNRFESINFTKKLFEFIGTHKKRHMIKFERSVKKDFEIIDGDYYFWYIDEVPQSYIDAIIFRRGKTDKLLLKDGTYNNDYINLTGFNVNPDSLGRKEGEKTVTIKKFFNFEQPTKVFISNAWKNIGY